MMVAWDKGVFVTIRMEAMGRYTKLPVGPGAAGAPAMQFAWEMPHLWCSLVPTLRRIPP